MAKREGVEGKVKVEAPYFYQVPELEGTKFDAWVTAHRHNKDEIDRLEKRNKELAVEIEAMLLVAGQKHVRVGGLLAVQCDGTSASRLDPKQLLLAGVEADVIKACTVAGGKYTYIQVRRDGDKDGDE